MKDVEISIIKSPREFERKMENVDSDTLILVWCFAPCSISSRKMAQSIANKYESKNINFWQINADKCKELLQVFNISRIPSVMAWKDRKLLYVEEYVSEETIVKIIKHKNHCPPKPGVLASFISTWHIICLEMSSIFCQFIDKIMLNWGYLFRILPFMFAVFYLIFVGLLSYWILLKEENMKFMKIVIAEKSFDQISWFMKGLILVIYVPLLWFAPVLVEDLVNLLDKKVWSKITQKLE